MTRRLDPPVDSSAFEPDPGTSASVPPTPGGHAAGAPPSSLLSAVDPSRRRPPKQLVRIRDARDQVLATTPKGRRYLRMIDDHAPELVAILAADAKVAGVFQCTVDLLLADTEGQRHDDPRISEAAVHRLVETIDLVASRASPAFAAELKQVRRELAGRRGVSLRELIG